MNEMGEGNAVETATIRRDRADERTSNVQRLEPCDAERIHFCRFKPPSPW